MKILKIKDWKESQQPQFAVLKEDKDGIVSVIRLMDSKVFTKDEILGEYLFYPPLLEGLRCFFIVKVRLTVFNNDRIHCGIFHTIHVLTNKEQKPKNTDGLDLGIMGWGGRVKINDVQINGNNGYLTDAALKMLKLDVPLINHYGEKENANIEI